MQNWKATGKESPKHYSQMKLHFFSWFCGVCDLLLRVVEDGRSVGRLHVRPLLVDFEDAGLPHISVPDDYKFPRFQVCHNGSWTGDCCICNECNGDTVLSTQSYNHLLFQLLFHLRLILILYLNSDSLNTQYSLILEAIFLFFCKL